jgi:hypothetical protein
MAPYLINVKHLDYEQAYDILSQWLDKCNKVRELDFDISTKLEDGLNSAIDKGYLPISLDNPKKEPKTLKTENKEFYTLLKTRTKSCSN